MVFQQNVCSLTGRWDNLVYSYILATLMFSQEKKWQFTRPEQERCRGFIQQCRPSKTGEIVQGRSRGLSDQFKCGLISLTASPLLII
jgi:hypothetical protein